MPDSHPQVGLAKASTGDMLAFLAQVAGPTIAKGVLIRRPAAVALAARFGLDTRAVRTMQRMRRKHGDGPLLFSLAGRPQAVLLAPEHVNRVLVAEPDLFSPATREKRAALSHFEPHVSLISRPPERGPRRQFHDAVLESGCPVHSMAGLFTTALEEEAATLLARVGHRLGWSDFTKSWHRAIRRVVLGDVAADDDDLTDMLARLRSAGNWASFHPKNDALRHEFRERLAAHLRAARPGSLAASINHRRDEDETDPIDQVTQWLFAFDAAGIATFRALALIATAPGALETVRAESTLEVTSGRPFTRACLYESVRLWPTTPFILRETTRPSVWGGDTMKAETQVIIYVPFFHRDDERLPEANRFAPELWLDSRLDRQALIPFSAGQGRCPAQHFVPLLASSMIAALLSRHRLTANQRSLPDANEPLPGTLDHFNLSFQMTWIAGAATAKLDER